MKFSKREKKGLVILIVLVFVLIVVHQVVFFFAPLNLGSYGNRSCPIGTREKATRFQQPGPGGEVIMNTGLPVEKICISNLGYQILKNQPQPL